MKTKHLCYSFLVFTEITASDTEINEIAKWEALQSAIESSSIRSAFELFRSHNIEPILIKGWAAGRFYPGEIFRPTSDIDLAVAASDFQNADRVMRTYAGKGLAIDLHRELRHLDTLLWADLFHNSELVELDGSSIRVLRPEDHFRVLAVHWLTDGGWFRDRLWDFYYAIENGPVDFDWARCLNSAGPIRRRWITSVIGLTHKYFGLDLTGLSFADEAKDIPQWLIKAVEREWSSGVRMLPLYRQTSDLRGFLTQVKKRVPPNPIHATIDMEGSFDAPTRIHYQMGTFIKRIVPGISKFFTAKREQYR